MTAVATFYTFVDLDDPVDDLDALATRLHAAGHVLGLRGTVLLAPEGINGTLSGNPSALDEWVEALCEDPRFAALEVKYSAAEANNRVFDRLKVRVRPEIVTFGQPGVRPARRTGTKVNAERWNELLDDPGVVVLDTRNRYETAIGTFPGARDPDTGHFREFAAYVETHLDPSKQPRIAMCCTGGIRCEKASAWLLELGFEAVYQLDGGILRYLETVPAHANRWQGECFVFDQRVSVDTNLGQGRYQACGACGRPLSDEDMASPLFEQGVACPHCDTERPPGARDGFRERQRQAGLAAARGTRHLGPATEATAPSRGGRGDA